MKSPISSSYVIPGIPRETYTPNELIKDVCEYFHAPEEMVLAPREKDGAKKMMYATPRQVAMFLLKESFPKFTYGYIGSLFGGRDHATVMHAVKVINNMCDTDPSFKMDFTEISSLVTSKVKCNTKNITQK